MREKGVEKGRVPFPLDFKPRWYCPGKTKRKRVTCSKGRHVSYEIRHEL